MSGPSESSFVVPGEDFFKERCPDAESFSSELKDREASVGAPKEEPVLIESWGVDEILNWEQPEGHKIMGDCHIVRGEVFVIGGTQGVGKSKAVAGLAASCALGIPWLGREVHSKVKTLIIQNENGPSRLQDELRSIVGEVGDGLRGMIEISPPPPEGLKLHDPKFQAQLRAIIERFQPGLIIFDPWNAIASDDKQKDYAEAFRSLKSVCFNARNPPAIGIVAHLRKPNVNDKKGRGGMHRLSGSHLLASIPRCVFILESVTDDETDDRVVLSCAKNNNGRNGERSAWLRTMGLYRPLLDFAWDEYDDPPSSPAGRKPKRSDLDYAALLPGGGLSRADWFEKANDEFSVSQSTFDRARRALVKAGVVHKSEVLGRYQPINEKGSKS